MFVCLPDGMCVFLLSLLYVCVYLPDGVCVCVLVDLFVCVFVYLMVCVCVCLLDGVCVCLDWVCGRGWQVSVGVIGYVSVQWNIYMQRID